MNDKVTGGEAVVLEGEVFPADSFGYVLVDDSDTLHLPNDFPLGPVRITIEPIDTPSPEPLPESDGAAEDLTEISFPLYVCNSCKQFTHDCEGHENQCPGDTEVLCVTLDNALAHSAAANTQAEQLLRELVGASDLVDRPNHDTREGTVALDNWAEIRRRVRNYLNSKDGGEA